MAGMEGRGVDRRVIVRPADLEGAARLLTSGSDPRVANRRGLARSLERDLAAARRSGRPLAVAMVDLDHFKEYNDREGHPVGDLLLRAATRAWANHLRAGDLLARYGGEEFAVVLPDCGAQTEVVGIVDRLRRATPGETTASAGVALWDGREPAAQLIRRADAALYEAKR